MYIQQHVSYSLLRFGFAFGPMPQSFTFQLHERLIVAPLSRLTILVLDMSTLPVQFHVAFVAYVWEFCSEHISNTLLTTSPAQLLPYGCTFRRLLVCLVFGDSYRSSEQFADCLGIVVGLRYGFMSVVLTTF